MDFLVSREELIIMQNSNILSKYRVQMMFLFAFSKIIIRFHSKAKTQRSYTTIIGTCGLL